MAHDYIVAGHRIRLPDEIFTQDNKLFVTAFAPFQTIYDAAQTTILDLRCDQSVVELSRAGYVELDTFEFDDADADCSFGRNGESYVFIMTPRKGGPATIFIKHDQVSGVASNINLCSKTDYAMLRFGLWMIFGIAINPLHYIPIHSSVVSTDNGAVLFLGESGTGKSTHTRLWCENIDGAELLNDDSPIIGMVGNIPTVFGSPWSGKTHCYRNENRQIRGIVRLSQAPRNKIRRLQVIEALGALLPSCPPAFAYDETLQDAICMTLSKVISCVPIYHLECLPNADAARLSHDTIFGTANR